MFHHTGVSSKNVTLGVPWLKEIINLTTQVKVPSLPVCKVKEVQLTVVAESVLSRKDQASQGHRTRTACFSSRCIHPSLFSIHLVSHSPGFIVKMKKVLECICVNCGKLKADIVRRHPNSYSFHTPPPKFSGGSFRNSLENPKPAQRWSLQSFVGRLAATNARFQSLDHRIRSSLLPDTRCAVEWGTERVLFYGTLECSRHVIPILPPCDALFIFFSPSPYIS